ncbi:MAG: hypothetical protein NTW97_06675 [Candidatus Krumholzibacteria bacterium]|nr:hypothetical protein [Candidatus Krumholzibacteria bacterium]
MKIQGRMLVAVLVLIFVAGLFGGVAAKGKPVGKVPRLVIASKTVQLGEVLEGQDFLYTFTLKNAGDVELQILNVRPG